MKTLDEIYAAMQGIMDGAEDRDLTDAEVAAYEGLEAELGQTKRQGEIRARHNAYSTPIAPAIHVSAPKPDNGLDQAFNAYLRTGVPNADISGLRATNAQSEGSSTAGGYLVPSGFRQKMIETRKAFGGFAAAVEEIDTPTGGPLEWPSNDDTANTGDITAESAAVASGADLVFGTVNIGAYKYTSAGAGSNLPLRVPVELIQDSAFDIQGFIARKLAMRIARKQAVHWVTGTGVGQPLGIVAASLTSDRDLDTADTPDYEDLVEFQDLLDEEYTGTASWLMKKNTWSQLRLIVDLNGRPILQEANDSITGLPQRRLLGSPVIIDEAMPTLSSAGDTYCMAYGDFRESYVIRRVRDFTLVVNPYSRASNGEIEYTAWERADGTVQNRSAYKIMQNNT